MDQRKPMKKQKEDSKRRGFERDREKIEEALGASMVVLKQSF